MKLIVGLGNPGKEYDNTRHNVGFNLIDFYVNSIEPSVSWSSKFDGLVLDIRINNEKVIFLKPQTFMNLSGNSVRKVVDFYNIAIDDILIISDDLDLSIGNFKLKSNGSCGGHNGLRSIESQLGTTNYKRLKVGISKSCDTDTKDYVLGNFSSSDRKMLNDLFGELKLVLDDYFKLPFSDLMNKYNRKNR